MSVIGFRKLSIWFVVFISCASIIPVYPIVATPPSPRLEFQKSVTTPDYLGTISDYGSWRLEEVRISLYDYNKQLMETGLLSEYSRDPDFGHYLGFRDINGNNKVDSIDTFYIYGKAGVSSNWGAVLTYERTGKTLTSSTISGKNLSLEEENEINEIDRRITVRYAVLTLMLINLLIILAVVYRMPWN